LIKKGIAEVYVADKGFEPVATIGVGSVFGEDALVTNNPRNASVIMASDGVLMKLEKQSFYELLKQPVVTMVTPGNVFSFLQADAGLLDVRTQKEFELGHHKEAMNLPLHLSYLKSVLLDKDKQYITYSSSDERAKASAFLLAQQGFKVFAMQGGIYELPKDQIELFKDL
jgi:rhodanese-related sulfurtransferase